MKLSIVIPIYNEKKTIKKIISNVKNASLPNKVSKEIICIDDYSTDGTREILENELKGSIDMLLLHDENQGKGAALQTGFNKVSGDIVIVQDADLEYDPKEYINLIAPILENNADVVYGSRFMGGRPHRVLYFWHMLGNHFLTFLSNMFTNLNLTDMETCYKVFRRDILKRIKLEEKRFGIEPELTAKIAKLDCAIYEVGISYYGRKYDEGKKIGWKDGVRAIICILKYNFPYYK